MTEPRLPHTGIPRLTRRAFVRAGVAAGVTAGVCVASGCGAGPILDDALLLRPRLLEGFDMDAVRAFGVAYRATVPQEATADALRRALDSAAREARPWPWSPPPTIDQLVTADFTADRVMSVDGWLLAITEARQCALVSLS